MEKSSADWKQHATENNQPWKKTNPSFEGFADWTCSNQKFCHTCRQKFHDVDSSNDSNNDSNQKEFVSKSLIKMVIRLR